MNEEIITFSDITKITANDLKDMGIKIGSKNRML